MAIAIDCNPLYTDHRFRGIGQYLYNLVLHLSGQRAAGEICLYTNKAATVTYPGLPLQPLPIRQEAKALEEQLALDGVDLLHLTDYYFPLLGQAYRFCRDREEMKKIVTIYDIIPLIFPHRYPTEYRFFYENVTPWLGDLDGIITISHSNKQDLVRYLNLPEEKLMVVHGAVDHSRFHTRHPAEKIAELKQRWNLLRPYFLYVGGLDWRKNVYRLFMAFRFFLQVHPKPYDLIMIGLDSPPRIMARYLHRPELEGRVRFLGYVSNADLSLLYHAAAVFVMPSIYEGFGLPLLEAMASGTPVISSSLSSIPEVVGENALLVDPLSWEQIAMAMLHLAEDDKLYSSLVEKGIARAREFTWEGTARQTWRYYQKVLG